MQLFLRLLVVLLIPYGVGSDCQGCHPIPTPGLDAGLDDAGAKPPDAAGEHWSGSGLAAGTRHACGCRSAVSGEWFWALAALRLGWRRHERAFKRTAPRFGSY